MGSRMWNAVGKNLSHGGDLLMRIQQDIDAERRRKEELARQDGIRAEESEYRENRDEIADQNYLKEWVAKRADMLRKQRLEDEKNSEDQQNALIGKRKLQDFKAYYTNSRDWANYNDLNNAAMHFGVSNDPEVQEFLQGRFSAEQLDQRRQAQSNKPNPVDLLNTRQKNALELIKERHENALEQIRARGVQSRSTKSTPSGGTREGSNSAKSYDVNTLEAELAQVEATIKALHEAGGTEYDMGMKKSIADEMSIKLYDAKRLRKLISELKSTSSGVRIPANAPASQDDPAGLGPF